MIELSSFFNLVKLIEPNSFFKVVKLPEWCKAIKDDIQALEKINTWTLTHLLIGKKARSRRLYKIKYRVDDNIKCYKTCLLVL